MHAFFLLTCPSIKRDGDGEEYEVRQPCRHERGHDIIDRESGADGGEQDIRSGQNDAYPQVFPHASAYLPARHRYAQEGHDEGAQGGRPALMVLHLKGLYVARSAFPLPLHVMAQLRGRHLLRLLRGDEEFVRDDRQDDVLPLAALQTLAHACEGAFGIVLQVPVFQGVVVDPVGGGTGHEGLAVKLLDGTPVTHLVVFAERLDIEDSAGFHL